MISANYDIAQFFQKTAFDFENFILEPAEIREIDTLIAKRSKPVHVKEIAELIISNRLEKIAGILQARVYSPMDKYSIGEIILFCFPDERLVIGEVLWIEKGRMSSQFGQYDLMGVSLQGFGEEKKYASNCLAFSKKTHVRERSEEGFVLPIDIVNDQKEKIIPGIVNSLSGCEEFLNIDEKWFIRRALPEIRPDEFQLCHRCIKEKGFPLPSEFLICEVLKISPESDKFESFMFSLNYCLQQDENFVKFKKDEEIQWDIRRPIPPKTIQNTVSQEAIKTGFIKITKGLRDLLEYCNLSKEITFKAYGEYEIHAYIDNEAGHIYGDQIRMWFEENQLKPGDMVFIGSPDTPEEKPDRPPIIVPHSELDLLNHNPA